MFTDPPAASRSSRSDAEAAAGVVWWCSPQLSNQPSQNSEHMSGPVGCAWRRRASRSVERDPNEPVLCSEGREPSSSIVPIGWSTLVKGTVSPIDRCIASSSRRYEGSEP